MTNVGAALARVRREVLQADLKHGRENRQRTSAAAWLAVIDKQRGDINLALRDPNPYHLKKELSQIAAAAVIALARLEELD